MSGRRKLLIFVGKTLLFIVVLSIIWLFLAQAYTRLLVAVANWVAPSQITLAAEQSSVIIHNQAVGTTAVDSLPFQGGLVMLLALILATPGLKLKWRLVYLVAGAAITFVIHIIGIVIIAINARETRPLIVLFASVGVDLFPVLIWAALSARYWWPGLQSPAQTPSVNTQP
jgi:hypothetical protein